MILLTLQPVRIKRQGDKANIVARTGKSACQGSPLRPTLFNIYMDTYVEWLRDQVTQKAHQGAHKNWNTALFADNVRLQAAGRKKLQTLLRASTGWAKAYGMSWNMSK